jgi:hypothetical protein
MRIAVWSKKNRKEKNGNEENSEKEIGISGEKAGSPPPFSYLQCSAA